MHDHDDTDDRRAKREAREREAYILQHAPRYHAELLTTDTILCARDPGRTPTPPDDAVRAAFGRAASVYDRRGLIPPVCADVQKDRAERLIALFRRRAQHCKGEESATVYHAAAYEVARAFEAPFAISSDVAARCPTCDSRDPGAHPAMVCDGEVELCGDPWHKPSADQIKLKWAKQELQTVREERDALRVEAAALRDGQEQLQGALAEAAKTVERQKEARTLLQEMVLRTNFLVRTLFVEGVQLPPGVAPPPGERPAEPLNTHLSPAAVSLAQRLGEVADRAAALLRAGVSDGR